MILCSQLSAFVSERFQVKAIYAAPFAMNERTQDPAAGMEMSYQEILRIMKLCGKQGCCEVKEAPVLTCQERYSCGIESGSGPGGARDVLLI